MKKYILVILSLITALALLPIKATAAFAVESEESGIETGIFLPTSYLQYYKLDNPYAICRYTDDEGKEVVAISHKDEIAIYRNEQFRPIKLDLSGNQVKTIDHYGSYLLYVFDLGVYCVDMTGFNGGGWTTDEKVKKIDGKSASDVSVKGDRIAVSTESNVFIYEISGADGFTYSDEPIEKFQAEKPSNILYGKNGVYYSTTTGEICKCGETEPIKTGIDGIRSIAEDEDGKIYYSCNGGIYSLAADEKTVSEIAAISDGEEKDLGKIYNPQGICLTGKGLWVVDGALNAVQEIDLTDNSFTKFAITTNSKAINRLSARVSDLCVDGDKIYALDDDRIVVINDINGVNTYNKIDLYGDAESFAVGGGYLCRYSGGHLSCYKIAAASERDDFSFDIDEICKVQASDVCDIAYLDGNFFVLAREPHHGKGYPLILALSVEKKTLSRLSGEETEESEPKKITADIFGNVYYAAEDDNEYKFYQLGVAEPLYTRAKNGETLIKLQTDMDGKLYALYSGNKVECYAGGGEVFSKTLILSDNLTGMDENPVVSMCLSYNSDTAYFLFKGLILKSTSDMQIATPSGIKVPDGFTLCYDENTVFAKLKENSKTFSVTEKFGEYFNYTQTAESEDVDYAIFAVNDKYSLAISNGARAIVRNEDIAEETKFTLSPFSDTKYMYAAVGFNGYSVPVEESCYKTASALSHEKLRVLGEVTFNGKEYYAVETANGKGYILKSFLLDRLAAEKTEEQISSAYLYLKGGASVWQNADLSGESVVLSDITKVKVLSAGETLMVEYDGKTWYASTEFVYFGGRQKTNKALAVLLLALSLTGFALFFERRYQRAGNE